MKQVFVTAVLVVVASSVAFAGETIGWRGDGSGLYPKADPPVQWSRVSKTVAALRFQAPAPKDDQPAGQAMPDGIIREWLLLGPVKAEKNDKGALTDPVLAEDQTKLQPADGQELAGAKWKVFKTDTAYIDCAKEFDTYGKKPDLVAYAATNICSPAEADCVVRVMHSAATALWVNGKPTHKLDQPILSYTPQSVKLQKGWNRVLVRIVPDHKTEQNIVAPWYVSLAFQAAPGKSQYDQKNIAWATTLPAGDGFGGSIVVGGKVFLQSEPADLVCLDAATGKILWVRSNNYSEVATEDERKAQPDVFKEIEPLAARLKEINDSFAAGATPKLEGVGGGDGFKEKVGIETKLYGLMRKVDDKKYLRPKGQDVGYSGFTPVSDGKHVWAWFASGVTCCYNVDGKLVWRRLDNEGSLPEHGYASSPRLVDGKLLVYMRKMLAFDAATGERLWATDLPPGASFLHGTSAPVQIGQTGLLVMPSGHILRISDGKVVRAKATDIVGQQPEIASPVTAGSAVYRTSLRSVFYRIDLPTEFAEPFAPAVRSLKIDTDKYPTFYLTWHMSSPLVHEGLAYLLNNTGVLTVVDVEKMEVVYQKLLDLDHFQSAHEGAGRGIGVSPSLAGGRIYLMGNTGSTIVIKPGRSYEQLAKNKIENVFFRYYGQRHERFVGNPAFDGKKMFLRGERTLYCIEAP